MRIEPKDFQDNAVLRLTEELESARREIERGRPQAVVLSSPTGSGKTVIVTLLMERLWAGHESIAADRNAIFLWISDSPELNIQSKEKIEAASDVFPASRLVVIDNDFNRERFTPGHIYFLNTQKLGVSSLLTKPGDGRTWTIWHTIENTAKASPAHFNLIVDEAHRGMGLSAKAESTARTLIQRFIKGAPEIALSPVPLVIGMSATPARFNKVLEGAQRITRPRQGIQSRVRRARELKESRTIAVEVTSENIDDLFTRCETILGEGLKDEYWRRVHDHDEPELAKLELFCVLQDPASVRSVQEECGERIDKLFERYGEKIDEMPSSRREQYARIRRQGTDPRPEKIHAPELIEVRKEIPLWDSHLFLDGAGRFGWKANTWEDMVLREAMKDKNFLGWLRNIPKKRWALCVPYGQGQKKPMYPDLLVFRHEGNKIKIDILEPHDDSRGDAAEKAVGLADFARRHGTAFGHIEMIRVVKGQIQRLRLHQGPVRDKVIKVTDLKHLQELYEQLG